MGERTTNPSSSDVRLRDVIETDLPIFFEDQQDPEGSRMAAFTPRDRRAFMEHWDRILREDTVFTKTVLFEGHVAGNVVSFVRSGKREVGYWIGRDFWGKGIATRALSQFLDHVTVRPLYAVVAAHNVGSIRVLEKCGFVRSDQELEPPEERRDPVEEILLELEA